MNQLLVLRILILAEVVCEFLGAAVSVFDEYLLPPALQNYANTQWDIPWSWREWLLAAICLVALPTIISAYVGLWRGRRKARLLYTASWALTVPAFFLLRPAPEMVSGLGQIVTTAGILASGMIFGLLYFSDLRHHFQGGYENDWRDSGYL
jgi:hypothetical protein